MGKASFTSIQPGWSVPKLAQELKANGDEMFPEEAVVFCGVECAIARSAGPIQAVLEVMTMT